MPWRDWQFWVVTVLALAGLLFMLRAVLPRSRKKPALRKVSLTVRGEKV
jgi:hypothetical protein